MRMGLEGVLTEAVHKAVLADEVLHLLAPTPGQVFFDGTLGAGGHAERILARTAPDGRLIGIDRDRRALDIALARLAGVEERLVVRHGTFSEIAAHLEAAGESSVDGMLIDLGFSSMQIDDGARGFSFSLDGPLDMRMDTSRGETARDLIRGASAEELVAILRDYGEERYAKRIAARLKEDIRDGGLETTGQLAALVDSCIPARDKRGQRIHPATRTFQALRIAVNRELDELDRFLEVFPSLLRVGGRCAVISFHSLEDRRVKNRFRELAWSLEPARGARGARGRARPPDLPPPGPQAGRRLRPREERESASSLRQAEGLREARRRSR